MSPPPVRGARSRREASMRRARMIVVAPGVALLMLVGCEALLDVGDLTARADRWWTGGRARGRRSTPWAGGAPTISPMSTRTRWTSRERCSTGDTCTSSLTSTASPFSATSSPTLVAHSSRGRRIATATFDDAGTVYSGGVSDGRYVYLVPYRTHRGRASRFAVRHSSCWGLRRVGIVRDLSDDSGVRRRRLRRPLRPLRS
jgi:hypothetical protein